MKWANIERRQRLFDYTAGTHFVLKHGYPKKVIQLYHLTRAVLRISTLGILKQVVNLRRNLHDISPGGQRVRVGIARAIYGGLQRIFTTWLWSRNHPALAFFSPCTTKDWFILWFAACQRFTGPLSPRFSGMFDMPLLANSIPKYDNHGTIHLDYCNQIATLKQLFLNIFEQKSSHLQIHHFFLIIRPDPSLSCWFLTISHFIFTAMCQDSPFASLDPATCRDPWWYQDLILGETKIKIKAAHLDADCQVYFFPLQLIMLAGWQVLYQLGERSVGIEIYSVKSLKIR